jgi:photosystem II stability/assembly factor-like uncharacterized protein
MQKSMLILLLFGLLLAACTPFDGESLGSIAVATAQEVPTRTAVPLDSTPLSASTTPYATYLPLTAVSQGYSWTRTNPGGGGAFNVVGAGPAGNNGEPGIILAGSDLAGAYISHDQGSQWELIGLYRGLDNTHASGIGFDPNNRDVLFIGTEAGIYRSENAGATVQNVLDDGYITDIELAVTDSAIGYATFHSAYNMADGVIYKTVDNGRSWKQISNSSLPTGYHILKLIVDPIDENRLYLLTGEGRFTCGTAVVYESVDGGINWTQIASSVGQIIDVALNPNDSNMLYVTSYGDVWDEGYECISDDLSGGFLHRGTYSQASGWQWEQVTNSSNVGSRNALVWLDSDNQQAIRLLDIEALELWESIDNGIAWTLVSSGDSWGNGWTDHAYSGSFNGDSLTIGTDMSDPDALLWIDSQFAYASRDNGRTFDSIYTQNQGGNRWQSTGIDNIIMVDLAIDADATHLYTALADMGCFRSDDYGGSWQSCNDPAYTGWWGATGGNAATVEADPTEAGSVWITQAGEMTDVPHSLLHSDDFGATWREIIAWDDTVVPSGLSVDAGSDPNNRTLFITVGGDVWRGKSDGSGWTAVFNCGGCRYTTTRKFGNDLVLFAGGEAGLFRSDDGGNSWAEVGLPEMRGALGDDFLNKYWAGVATIEFDPSLGREEWVYATVFGEGGGLYRSTQRGDSGSWQKILNNDFMRDVAISPADGNMIFVTSSSNIYSGGYEPGSSGVLFSDDGGTSWQEVNSGLPWPFANPIEIDTNQPSKVFMGSPGAGFFIGEFGK